MFNEFLLDSVGVNMGTGSPTFWNERYRITFQTTKKQREAQLSQRNRATLVLLLLLLPPPTKLGDSNHCCVFVCLFICAQDI